MSSEILHPRFPETGEYPVRFWAELFVCEPKTVAEEVSKLGIPHRVYLGREKWIEAEAMRKAFPLMTNKKRKA